jgi:pimeloyl-ACP methyl ester carboxylesterase
MSELNDVRLPQGTVRYRDTGTGEPIVFLHGLLVNGLLWRKVTPRLERDFRCIVPDLPLGAHSPPLEAGADLSPPGLARIVDDFMRALELEDVTLVGNDTGGAIAQVVAAHHPDRLARLVLTSCDAYDNFLPPAFRYLQVAARVPGALNALMQSMRLEPLRRTPLAFGWLAKRTPGREVTDAWIGPALASAGTRRDVTKALRGIDPRHTNEAIARLRSFDRPTLIAWAREDRFFKAAFAERLARDIPTARLEWVEDSYTFVSEDQPERVAELIAGFVREPRAAAPASG